MAIMKLLQEILRQIRMTNTLFTYYLAHGAPLSPKVFDELDKYLRSVKDTVN